VDECGGFVWDYFCGEVVCVDSGEVVDRIYDYGPVYRGSDERDWVRRVDPDRLREFWRLRRRLRRRQVFLRRARFLLRGATRLTMIGFSVMRSLYSQYILREP